MGWSEEVHRSRLASSLAQARSEYKDRRRGYTVTPGPDTSLLPFLGLIGALSGLAWWHREGRHRLRPGNWRNLPLVKQLHALVTNNQQAAATSVRTRQRPSVPRARPAPLQQTSQQEQQARAASHSTASSSTGGWVTSPTAVGLTSPDGNGGGGKSKSKNKKKNKKKK